MRVKIFLFCMLCCLLFGGCAPQNGDYFAPFGEEFSARIEGTWQEMDFSAELAAQPQDAQGTRVMTLTFYAPVALEGTVLTRDASGQILIEIDGISLPLEGVAAQGYGALFALFPADGEVTSVTRESGGTRVRGAEFSLLFAADGTPLAAENAVARVQVTAFVQ